MFLVRTRKNLLAIFTKAIKKLTFPKNDVIRIYDFMKPHSNKKTKFRGKKAPLFFAFLYLLLCFVSIFSIDPVLWFLKYAALFGVLTAVLLIAYIIRTDEL